jgi:hypothetical protein
MVKVQWYNEKGNVSVKVRDGVRPQILSKVVALLQDSGSFDDVVIDANGAITIPIAEDTSTGDTIYAHFEMTVNNKDGMTKTERKKKAKKAETEEEVIPELF